MCFLRPEPGTQSKEAWRTQTEKKTQRRSVSGQEWHWLSLLPFFQEREQASPWFLLSHNVTLTTRYSTLVTLQASSVKQ